MRKIDLCKTLLAAVLAVGLAVTVVGCKGKEVLVAPESKASAAESSEESSEVPEEKKTPEKVLEEQNVKLCTLEVKEVPYDSDSDFESLQHAEKVTVIQVLVAGKYDKKEFLTEGIEATSGEKEYNVVNDKTETWYNFSCMNVSKHKFSSKDGELYRIVSTRNVDPSYFCLKFSSNGNSYSIPLSNSTTPVPDDYVVKTDAVMENIVSFDGRSCYLDGLIANEYEHFYSGNGEHTFRTSKIVPFTILNADSDKPDITKFSYEPMTDLFDEITLAHVADVEAKVSEFSELQEKGTDCLYGQVEVNFSYTIHADTTIEDYDNIVKTATLMAESGYLVYNGDEGTTKIKLSTT